MRKLLQHLRTTSPTAVLLTAVLVAAALILISSAIDLFDYERTDGKQVGYSRALNWTVGFLLVAPLFYFFVLSAFQEVDHLADRLVNSRMLVDDRCRKKANAATVFKQRWTRKLHQLAPWILILALAGLAESTVEWWSYSGAPLWQGAPVPEDEIDWSVKFRSVPEEEAHQKHLNGVFSLFVFLQQGAFLSFLAFYLIFIVLLARHIRSFGLTGSGYRLIPRVEDRDERRGFQVFEPLTSHVLLAATFGFTLMYLSRLWNAYLHADGENSDTLYDFVIGDIIRGFRQEKFEGLSDSFFDAGDFTFSEYWDTVGALILFTACIVTVIQLLRKAAENARVTLQTHLMNSKAGSFRNLSRAECLKRLEVENMKKWPLNYPRENELLILATLAVISVVFFRIGLFFIGLMIFVTLQQARKLLTRRR